MNEFDKTIDFLLKSLDALEDSKRMTGRTTNMVSKVQDDDAAVFHNTNMSRSFPTNGKNISASTLNELEGKLCASSYREIHLDNYATYTIIKK